MVGCCNLDSSVLLFTAELTAPLISIPEMDPICLPTLAVTELRLLMAPTPRPTFFSSTIESWLNFKKLSTDIKLYYQNLFNEGPTKSIISSSDSDASPATINASTLMTFQNILLDSASKRQEQKLSSEWLLTLCFFFTTNIQIRHNQYLF